MEVIMPKAKSKKSGDRQALIFTYEELVATRLRVTDPIETARLTESIADTLRQISALNPGSSSTEEAIEASDDIDEDAPRPRGTMSAGECLQLLASESRRLVGQLATRRQKLLSQLSELQRGRKQGINAIRFDLIIVTMRLAAAKRYQGQGLYADDLESDATSHTRKLPDAEVVRLIEMNFLPPNCGPQIDRLVTRGLLPASYKQPERSGKAKLTAAKRTGQRATPHSSTD